MQRTTNAGTFFDLRARRDAFIKAVDQIDSDRFRMVIEFLRRQKVTEDELTAFLTGILLRFALEETGLKASRWTEIQRLHLSNSVSDELSILYVARGLEQL